MTTQSNVNQAALNNLIAQQNAAGTYMLQRQYGNSWGIIGSTSNAVSSSSHSHGFTDDYHRLQKKQRDIVLYLIQNSAERFPYDQFEHLLGKIIVTESGTYYHESLELTAAERTAIRLQFGE